MSTTYKIDKASIKSISYRIRGSSLRATLTWEGLGDETILAHWADGCIATATRSGMVLERIQATSEEHEIDFERSGEVTLQLLDMVDGKPMVRVKTLMVYEYISGHGLFQGDCDDVRQQIEEIVSTCSHELTITVEG